MACLFGHKWDGCICIKCGKTRYEGHLFENVPGKCQNKCVKCGSEIQLNHHWDGCICSICGERTSYVVFDSLCEKEITVFTCVVINTVKKWILATNVLEARKGKLKAFLSRFEKASEFRPFKLVIEDSVLALDQVECMLTWGFEKNPSGLVARQGMNAMEIASVKSLFGGLEGYADVVAKLKYDIKKYKTLLATESDLLPAPCSVVITRNKLISSGPKNRTRTTVFLNGNDIGSFIAGETLTVTTSMSENLISCSGNDDPPIRFQAQAGGEKRFLINLPEFITNDINAFSITLEVHQS